MYSLFGSCPQSTICIPMFHVPYNLIREQKVNMNLIFIYWELLTTQLDI